MSTVTQLSPAQPSIREQVLRKFAAAKEPLTSSQLHEKYFSNTPRGYIQSIVSDLASASLLRNKGRVDKAISYVITASAKQKIENGEIPPALYAYSSNPKKKKTKRTVSPKSSDIDHDDVEELLLALTAITGAISAKLRKAETLRRKIRALVR